MTLPAGYYQIDPEIRALVAAMNVHGFRTYTANADVNGARNILAAGHAVLACGGMVQSGHPLKQEPTEMIQATA